MSSVTTSPDCSFLVEEPAAEYHARSGEVLSSHLLADFRRCPELYRRKVLGLVPDEDRPSYLVGRATHTAILEGLDVFHREYAVGGPVNPKTGQPYGSNTKAWSEWAETQGKPTLTREQAELIERLAESVTQHREAQNLLAEGFPERVVRAEYCGVPCQIRMDWLNPYLGVVDLKTCDDLLWFETDARRYGYHQQLAFYVEVLRQKVGLRMPAYLLAVEKKLPYRVGLWRLGEDTLSAARQENEAAIARLRQCQANDFWPTGYEETRVLECA